MARQARVSLVITERSNSAFAKTCACIAVGVPPPRLSAWPLTGRVPEGAIRGGAGDLSGRVPESPREPTGPAPVAPVRLTSRRNRTGCTIHSTHVAPQSSVSPHAAPRRSASAASVASGPSSTRRTRSRSHGTHPSLNRRASSAIWQTAAAALCTAANVHEVTASHSRDRYTYRSHQYPDETSPRSVTRRSTPPPPASAARGAGPRRRAAPGGRRPCRDIRTRPRPVP